MSAQADYQYIVKSFQRAAGMADEQGRSGSALLWLDGLEHLESMKSERDDLLAIAIAYQSVRAAQAAYFKVRTQENLIASKQAEKALDAQVRAAIERANS